LYTRVALQRRARKTRARDGEKTRSTPVAIVEAIVCIKYVYVRTDQYVPS
jgi:hypothetical protein